jgi:hypothetical protein
MTLRFYFNKENFSIRKEEIFLMEIIKVIIEKYIFKD